MSNKHKILMLVILVAIIFGVLIEGKHVAGEVPADKVSFIEVTKYQYINSNAEAAKNWRFNEKESVNKFIKGLNKKERTYEKLDIRPRDFKVVVGYTSGKREEYSLWLNDKDDGQGVLMLDSKVWYLNSNLFFKSMLQ